MLSGFYFIVHLFIAKENQEVFSNPWERGQAVLGIYILTQRVRFTLTPKILCFN